MSDGYFLPDSFWDGFLEEYWGKQPLLARGRLSTPLASAAELFQCLVVGSDRLRAGEEAGLR